MSSLAICPTAKRVLRVTRVSESTLLILSQASLIIIEQVFC